MAVRHEDLLNDKLTLSFQEKEEIEQHSKLIAKIIKTRYEKGWTQVELAERCGLKQSAIARIEACSNKPNITTLIRVLTELGLRLSVEKIGDANIGEGIYQALSAELVDFFNEGIINNFAVVHQLSVSKVIEDTTYKTEAFPGIKCFESAS